ncbi:MAG: YIP1 family protein [Candidatus Acidiferrales bacterium]
MGTTAVAPAPGGEQAKIGAFGRVTGVLFSPGATFEDIARKPSWIVPMVLLIILNLGVVALVVKKLDWATMIRAQIESSSRASQLTEEQKEQQVAFGVKIAPFAAWGGGAIGIPILSLIMALAYWLGFNLLKGASLKFSTAFGIIVHALVPTLLAFILTGIILYLKPAGEISPDPSRMAATSLAAFLPSTAPKWLVSLGGSLDIFWFWCLALLAIGFSAANPRKISKGSAFGVVIGIWLVWVLAKVGWAAAFSS